MKCTQTIIANDLITENVTFALIYSKPETHFNIKQKF